MDEGMWIVVAAALRGKEILPRLSEDGNWIGVGNRKFVVDVQGSVRTGGRCCLKRSLLRHDRTVDEVVVCECGYLVYCQTLQSIDLMVRRKYSVDSENAKMKSE